MSRPTPDIQGSWRRGGDGLTIHIRQVENEIMAAEFYSNPTFSHTLQGSYTPGDKGWLITMVRTNNSNGCVTEMTGVIIKMSEDHINGSDSFLKRDSSKLLILRERLN